MSDQPTTIIATEKVEIDLVALAAMVNIDTYEQFALRTAKHLPTAYRNLWHGACGIVTEVGELFDAYKRVRIYAKALDVVNLVEEVGDVLWYINLHAFHSGIPLWTRHMSDTEMEALTEDFVIDANDEIDGILAGLTVTATRVFTRVTQDTIDGQKGDLQTDMGTLVALCTRLLNAYTGKDMARPYNLEDAMKANIVKLAKRYGEKFSEAAALGRDLIGERSMLEQALNIDNVVKTNVVSIGTTTTT